VSFFFPQISGVATLANHPQGELAKFGYRSEREGQFYILKKESH
jgi:hypothetical protein